MTFADGALSFVVTALFFAVAIVVFEIGLLEIWNAIKGFIRNFGEMLIRIVTFQDVWRKPAEAPVREPDWADAADEVGFFDPLPEPLWDELVLWTPAEREAFELDETARFIESVDRVLAENDKALMAARKAEEWQEWNRRMDLSEEQIRAAQERDKAALAAQKAHAEKMARRNGANLLPDDEDDLAALRVLNRTRPSRERRREERLG